MRYEMKKLIVIALAAFLFGCSAVSRWEPTLNDKVDKNQASVTQDVADCRVLADKAAGWAVEGLEGATVGAAGGAAEGAILGALLGGVSTGPAAAVGAPVGAVAALWWSEYDSNLVFKRSFSNCLYQRGHFPIN
jgi:outer membrane lipoprotein SlyB